MHYIAVILKAAQVPEEVPSIPPQNVLLWHGDSFELKAIEKKQTQDLDRNLGIQREHSVSKGKISLLKYRTNNS